MDCNSYIVSLLLPVDGIFSTLALNIYRTGVFACITNGRTSECSLRQVKYEYCHSYQFKITIIGFASASTSVDYFPDCYGKLEADNHCRANIKKLVFL